jgi:hypothetical protein
VIFVSGKQLRGLVLSDSSNILINFGTCVVYQVPHLVSDVSPVSSYAFRAFPDLPGGAGAVRAECVGDPMMRPRRSLDGLHAFAEAGWGSGGFLNNCDERLFLANEPPATSGSTEPHDGAGELSMLIGGEKQENGLGSLG